VAGLTIRKVASATGRGRCRQNDDDGNDVIDENDAIFADLRLWEDVNHDGISQPMELHTLPELGVAGISLAYAEAREVDQHGNSFRYKAAVYGTPGSPVGMTAWDVWLVGITPEPAISSKAVLRGPEPSGNPKELERCLKAANGSNSDWIAYCNSVPLDIRASCFSRGVVKKVQRRNWCYLHWGSVITCET
jgi:hypothetical protein